MEQNMVLKLMRVREGAIIPKQATAGSAGYDLCACMDAPQTIEPGEMCIRDRSCGGDPRGHGGLRFHSQRSRHQKGHSCHERCRCHRQRLPRRNPDRPAQSQRGAVHGAAGRAHCANDYYAVFRAGD